MFQTTFRSCSGLPCRRLYPSTSLSMFQLYYGKTSVPNTNDPETSKEKERTKLSPVAGRREQQRLVLIDGTRFYRFIESIILIIILKK